MDPPTNITPTLISGGTLTSGTTYYFKIITSYNGGYYSSRCMSVPSIEVSATTTDTHRTIQLDWDVPTGSTLPVGGYIVYVTEVAGDYDYPGYHAFRSKTETSGNQQRQASVVTNQLIHDGTYIIDYNYFATVGMPRVDIETDVEEPEDVNDALIAAGLSANTSTQPYYFQSTSTNTSYEYHRTFEFSCHIYIQNDGTFHISYGRRVLHRGNIHLYSTGTLQMGYKSTGGATSFGGEYTRAFPYGSLTHVGDFNIYGSRYTDNVYPYGILLNYNGAIVSSAKFDIIDSYIYAPALQIGSSAYGLIDNTIIYRGGFMQCSGKITMNDTTLIHCTTGIYCYYSLSTRPNPWSKNQKNLDTTYDIRFHKNTNVNTFAAINFDWYSDVPRAILGGNPSNLTVDRKYEAIYKLLDKNDVPIVGATSEISCSGYTITPEPSNEDGYIYLASGTALSGNTDTLYDDTKSWTTDEFQDLLIEIYEGTGVGQERGIYHNTATGIEVKLAWDIIPDATSKYRIPIHLTTHKYTGNAALANPYCYDTIDYGNFTMNIKVKGFRAIKSLFTINKGVDDTVIMERLGVVVDTNGKTHIELGNKIIQNI